MTAKRDFFDTHAEVSLLGAALLTADAAVLVAEQTVEEDFGPPLHKRLRAAVVTLVAAGQPVDIQTVTSELALGATQDVNAMRKRVTEIMVGCPAASHAETYLSSVLERSMRRQAWELGGQLQNAAATGQPCEAILESLRDLSVGMVTTPANLWPTVAAPATLAPEAFHGLAGDIVRTIEPHSEADPAALLTQFLVAFGSAVGRGPRFMVGATPHRPNLYAVVVGDTAEARKGTGLDAAVWAVRKADTGWYDHCRLSGLSTGEGLIWRLRDPITKTGKNGQTVVVDDGVTDKRLLVTETEFGRTLQVGGRSNNPLSSVLRQAWDGETLEIGNKTSPARATDPHVSLIGHITRVELRKELAGVDSFNGFANRFLWVASRQSKELPDGGFPTAEEMNPLISRTRTALDAARRIGEMRRDQEAGQLWAALYGALKPRGAGTFRAITARGQAQTLRMSITFALLDGSSIIRRPHLEAAVAVWDYCCQSALWAFGDSTGDNHADMVLRELRSAWPAAMSKTDLWALFGRNWSVPDALGLLEEYGLADKTARPNTAGRGRPVEWWTAVPPADQGLSSFNSSDIFTRAHENVPANSSTHNERNEINNSCVDARVKAPPEINEESRVSPIGHLTAPDFSDPLDGLF